MSDKDNEKKDDGVNVIATEKPVRRFWRIFFVVLLCLVGLCLLLGGSVFAYSKAYTNRVFPGVYLGNYPLGGMTRDEVSQFISQMSERLAKEGVVFIFNENGEDKKIGIDSNITEGDAIIEVVSLKIVGSDDAAFKSGRTASGWYSYLQPLFLRFKPVVISVPADIEEKNFNEIFISKFGAHESQPRNATVKITSDNPLQYDIISEETGLIFDVQKIIEETKNKLAQLDFEPIRISQQVIVPMVKAEDLTNMDDKMSLVLSYGDLVLTYVDPSISETRTGRIREADIKAWLKPYLDETGEVWFDLEEESVMKQLDNYKYVLDIPAEESKFVMEDGKLKEFRSGSSGQILNMEKTLDSIRAVMRIRNSGGVGSTSTVALVVEEVEPKLKMADVNNLGITAVFGTGTSTFYDSHNNRIKNIAHAVERLNGTIIAPGDEFSTLRYAGPFTAENGYLPEEVIKGNLIKKEIGGGMCQIGTTLFRMAMNSGMPITERTNHSLVVQYYADPVNGNPGTDATVYEPILDFKFLNDTGNYLLLETKIDYKKQLLSFTLWGKPDGRTGSYSRPLVSRWIPAGEPQTIYTTTLEPGQQKCQNAFRGAVASFTYTRYTSSSEKMDKVFSSYYRPLQKICMVGAAPEGCSDPENCTTPVSSPASSTAPSEAGPTETPKPSESPEPDNSASSTVQ